MDICYIILRRTPLVDQVGPLLHSGILVFYVYSFECHHQEDREHSRSLPMEGHYSIHCRSEGSMVIYLLSPSGGWFGHQATTDLEPLGDSQAHMAPALRSLLHMVFLGTCHHSAGLVLLEC